MQTLADMDRHVGGAFFQGRWKNVRRAPPLFGSKGTISRFGELFRDCQYSLVSYFLLFFSRYPPVPSNL